MHWMYATDGGWIMMIAWWILLIAAVIFLVKWLSENNGGERSREDESHSATDILRRRFANSEISREEFEERKKILEQK